MSELTGNIGWENTIEPWQVAILLALLFLGSFWEIKKKKPRKIARTIALILALIALYIMYLSPYISIEKPLKSVVLLSDDTPQDIIDSLGNEYDLTILEEIENFRFKEVGKKEDIPLAELNYQIDTAFVYGYFSHLSPADYIHRKDIKIKSGIQLDYPKSISLGDSLKISIENLEDKPLKISAIVGTDSISLLLDARSQSRISVLPKAEGYVLTGITSRDQTYNFAVRVEDDEKYVIQILSATPDFEWKFLGDFLKSEAHSVYQQTLISKGKYKSSFFNWYDSLEKNRGVAKNLKVLIVDAVAWENLSPNGKNRYLKILRENRGSLIFRTNPNSQIQLDLDKTKSTKIFSTSDNLLQAKLYKYLQFNNLYQLDEVAKNAVFRRVTSDMVFGIINFQNSFQLKLSGKNKEYEQLWSAVFDELVRRNAGLFYDKSKWPTQYHPFFFSLWTNGNQKEISVFQLGGDSLKLKAEVDFIYPERFNYMFYPKDTGWHYIKLRKEVNEIPFYVHSESAINESQFRENYTYDYLNYLNFVKLASGTDEKKYNRKFVSLWIFVLFVCCVGYLWIEDKIT
jgi:hypothetical protein